ncbi:DgyrCDS5899 [Dimorphilus gyrociliatus]|uniref:DgyrCDS5899 n=1 Tax=Dimorphilus gyrociliatus TaxID=2664684 RepID=A0A7I8VP58_9ANNE|nr:DgyrCDS5899 [Dimorphilus gyrociliatus]
MDKCSESVNITRKLFRFIEEGDICQVKKLLLKKLKKLNDSKFLQGLLQTVKEDRKEIFELLIRFKVLAGRPYPRDEKEELKSIKYILNNVITYLIQYDKPDWLDVTLRISIKIPKDRRELENVNRYLRMAINLNNRQCFVIILKFIRFSKNREAAALILLSNFEDKVDLFLKSISHLLNKECLILPILKTCIMHKVKKDDLKSIIPFINLGDKAKSQLCHTTLMNDHMEFFRYAMESKFFEFLGEHVYGTVFYDCTFLQELLDWYGELFKLHLNRLIIDERNTSWIMYRWEKMLIIFKHPKIGISQDYINILFESFILKTNDFLGSLPSKNIRQMWLSSFCVLLHCSENKFGLSQHVVNVLFSYLINNTAGVTHSLAFFYGTLIVTLISYGYTFTELDISDLFFNVMVEDSIQKRVYTLIMENCNQIHHNILFKHVNCQPTVMSLKGMARWAVRTSLKRPFQDNLKLLIKKYNLPLNFEKIINLQTEMEVVKLQPVNFFITDNQVVYESELNTESPYYESLAILSSYRNAAYF